LYSDSKEESRENWGKEKPRLGKKEKTETGKKRERVYEWK